MALPYAQSMAQLDGDLYVRKATLQYEASAVYDDVLHVGIRCGNIGNSSVLFHAGAFRRERLLVSCELVYVFADPTTQKSKPVPQPLRAVLQSYEAGEDMLDLRVGRWDRLGADAQPLRHQAFVAEQAIPAELEHDDADPGAVHAVAYNRLSMPLATGRWVQHAPGVAKIGRMAVAPAIRSAGIGRRLLEALIQSAGQAGNARIILHAEANAVEFYRRAGFSEQGEPFIEAGIPHLQMLRSTGLG
jgi:predicted GNAT family N-acyltransferase